MKGAWRRKATRLALGAALVMAGLATPALAAPAPRPDGVIRLEPWRTRWAMNVEIGGKPHKLLLDTGGGLTLVSRDIATGAGCEPWGRLTGFRMFGDRGDTGRCNPFPLTVAGQDLRPPVVGLINMGKLNPADAELEGLIGLNLFEGRAITLDLSGGVLVLENDASLAARVADMRPLPIRISREVEGLALSVLVQVPTEKGPVWMELDSGNGGTVLVSKPIASLFGLDPAVEGRQHAVFPLVDGVKVETDDAFTPDMIIDGNLGMPFLKHWVITLDLRDGRAWISPAAPPRS